MPFHRSRTAVAAHILFLSAGLAALSYAPGARAQTIERPVVRAGDSWTYRLTSESRRVPFREERDDVVVTRVTGSSIYFSVQPTGSQQAPQEHFTTAEWGQLRDLDGTETLVSEPLSFPLSAGKSWEVKFTDRHPTNALHAAEQVQGKYTVVGFETVEVPAGKFNAIKIEREGRWMAEVAPAQTVLQSTQATRDGVAASTQVHKVVPQTVAGRLYAAWWYAPEAKRWVKSVAESYDSNGVRSSRTTEELQAFKLAP